MEVRTTIAILASTGLHAALILGLARHPPPASVSSPLQSAVPLRVLSGSRERQGERQQALSRPPTPLPPSPPASGVGQGHKPGTGNGVRRAPPPQGKTPPTQPSSEGMAASIPNDLGRTVADLPGGPTEGPGADTAGTSPSGDPAVAGSALEGSRLATAESDLLRDARYQYALEVRRRLSRDLDAIMHLRPRQVPPEVRLRLSIHPDRGIVGATLETPCPDVTFCDRVRQVALGLRDLPAPPGGALEIRVPVRLQAMPSRIRR